MTNPKEKARLEVYGRSNGNAIFSGSKTECLKFIAYKLARDDEPLTIRRT